MRIGIKEVTNPLEVLECLVAFDSRDYGTAKRDRMLYAIILGWDDASYKSFGWSEEEIKEWKQMRERFERLKEVDICTADVVPKSEVEKLVQDGTRLGQENETLKDNNEHLAVMLEEAKAEVGKLQNELVIWKQNRFNLFQRLECYEMARQKVASEIFADIENLFLNNHIESFQNFHDNWNYRFKVNMMTEIAELKKKYTEGEQ